MTGRFLLQTSYQQMGGWQNFMTSRSRIVVFRRHGGVLRMIEVPRDSTSPPHLLATIPIRHETAKGLLLDFNAGFDKVVEEEDRTGEDYYGRAERQDYPFFRLLHRKMLSVMHDGCMLVFDQA
ncbi:MAG TPA: hypothetical protein VFY39_08055, partial [Gammaproteobacteria bacterium]|nr:hypothetical protein [Gammaproteobacteria bacterium]